MLVAANTDENLHSDAYEHHPREHTRSDQHRNTNGFSAAERDQHAGSD
jgi:hypothetical protein